MWTDPFVMVTPAGGGRFLWFVGKNPSWTYSVLSVFLLEKEKVKHFYCLFI